MKFIYIYCILFFSLSTFCQDKSKRKYDDGNFVYEFHVSDGDKVSLRKGVRFYWYSIEGIKSSIYGVRGKVLNGLFVKVLSSSGDMVERGSFLNGLKEGEWKEWYNGGGQKKIEFWNKGLREGRLQLFDVRSNLLKEGCYKKGRKEGRWEEYIGDTRIVNNWFNGFLNGKYEEYKNGELIKYGWYSRGVKHGIWWNKEERVKKKFKKGKLVDEDAKTFWDKLRKKKDSI
ncbi:toxin-antitoxin system YwqK family antitoxin [Tenacibaculum sp.]|uniref:toxin-antitoxin system YwqK family antitoxin n=1 Tax=Tenacibaculum sp. TaxID=1906242 RepID=UPI003D12F228